ncbi:MAG: oligosaccharide flippase family protein [Candidatus Omnitrophica bacterium]|nr:oligosaccharide flippase family protein [Candidatus Omnitrophota bacterium]
MGKFIYILYTKILNLIFWLGRYFKIDILYFFKNTLFLTLQKLVNIITSLILVYVLGKYTSPIFFGQYNYVIAIINFLVFFSLPGVNNALIYSVAQNYDLSYDKAFQVKSSFSILGSIVILFVALYYLINQHQFDLFLSLLLIAPLFPLLHCQQLFNDFLVAKKKFKLLSVFNILISIITTILVVSAIFLVKLLPFILFIQFLSTTFLSFLFFLKTKKFIKNKRVDANLYPYGFFLTINNFLPFINYYLGPIILGLLLPIKELAIYSAASRFTMAIDKNIFYKPLTAKLAQQTQKLHLQTLKIHWWKLIILGFLFFFILWTSLPVLIHLFFSDFYTESIKYARLLSISIVPIPLSWVLYDILVYQKRRYLLTLLMNISTIVAIILQLLLIPLYGINGLIFSIIFSRYSILILTMLMLIKRLKIQTNHN